MGDNIQFDQIQFILGEILTSLNAKSKGETKKQSVKQSTKISSRNQPAQADALDKFQDIIGQKIETISNYQKSLVNRLDDIAEYVKSANKGSLKNESIPAIDKESQPTTETSKSEKTPTDKKEIKKDDGLEGIKLVSSTAATIPTSLKVLPVRIVEDPKKKDEKKEEKKEESKPQVVIVETKQPKQPPASKTRENKKAIDSVIAPVVPKKEKKAIETPVLKTEVKGKTTTELPAPTTPKNEKKVAEIQPQKTPKNEKKVAEIQPQKTPKNEKKVVEAVVVPVASKREKKAIEAVTTLSNKKETAEPVKKNPNKPENKKQPAVNVLVNVDTGKPSRKKQSEREPISRTSRASKKAIDTVVEPIVSKRGKKVIEERVEPLIKKGKAKKSAELTTETAKTKTADKSASREFKKESKKENADGRSNNKFVTAINNLSKKIDNLKIDTKLFSSLFGSIGALTKKMNQVLGKQTKETKSEEKKKNKTPESPFHHKTTDIGITPETKVTLENLIGDTLKPYFEAQQEGNDKLTKAINGLLPKKQAPKKEEDWMQKLGKFLLIGGIAATLIAAFWDSKIKPWLEKKFGLKLDFLDKFKGTLEAIGKFFTVGGLKMAFGGVFKIAGTAIKSIGELIEGALTSVVDFVFKGFGGKAAAKAGAEGVEKAGGGLLKNLLPKLAGGIFKGIGKATLMSIPLIGSLISVYFAYGRFKKGDYIGAIIDLVSGIGDLLPEFGGTALSIGAAALNAFLDYKTEGQGDEKKAQSAKLDFFKGMGVWLYDKIKEIPILGPLLKAGEAMIGGKWDDVLKYLGESVAPLKAIDDFIYGSAAEALTPAVTSVKDFASSLKDGLFKAILDLTPDISIGGWSLKETVAGALGIKYDSKVNTSTSPASTSAVPPAAAKVADVPKAISEPDKKPGIFGRASNAVSSWFGDSKKDKQQPATPSQQPATSQAPLPSSLQISSPVLNNNTATPSNVQPTENQATPPPAIQPTEAPVVPKSNEQPNNTSDNTDEMSDSLKEHSTLLKALAEYQKQTAMNTKALIAAFGKSNGGNQNNIVNNISSPTSFISSPTTSSSFRQAQFA